MEYQNDEEETQRVLISAAMIASDVSSVDAWLRYFALGGVVDAFDVDAYLAGLQSMPLAECNLFAQAVNELIDEQPPRPRAPYRRTTSSTGSSEGDEPLDGLLRQWLFGTTNDRTRRQRDS